MKRIIDYTLARKAYWSEIEDEVRRLMRNGWQPFGSLCADKEGFSQPMVKYDDDDQIPDRFT